MTSFLLWIGYFTLFNMLSLALAFQRSTIPHRLVSKSGTHIMLRMASTVRDILPAELKRIITSDAKNLYQIVDVREKNELTTVALPVEGVIHLPLSESDTWANQILNGEVLNIADAEFSEVYNVKGGIHAYAEEVDPSIGTY
eukprot:scaffold3993_cov161-Ochromonas_danica.AAC.7